MSDTKLLQWAQEDLAVNPQAKKLGEEMESSKNLYQDLQDTYK